MSEPIVISHSPCADGFTAAWACWLVHPDWEYVSGVHGELPPDVTGKDVYLLDFSYKRPVLEQMLQQATSITILDHHASAQADLLPLLGNGTVKGVFDLDHSGAYLAWDWFHGTHPPLLVLSVEDRDLWKFRMSDTRDLGAAIFSYDYDFKIWSALRYQLQHQGSYDSLVTQGAAINRKHFKDVNELLLKTKRRTKIAGHEVWCANLPYTMASDACHILAAGEPFAATYYDDGNGNREYSLRSDDNGLDVSKIAVSLGGGGHPHAAGFRQKTQQ